MAINPKLAIDWYHMMRQQMDDLLRQLMALERDRQAQGENFTPLADVYETDTSYTIEMELPGFQRHDISVLISYNILVVEGIKRHDAQEKAVTYLCMERSFGRFRRLIELPPMVDLNRVKASYGVRGVLTITLPKLADKIMVTREIPIE